jgi:hypothetical protein
VFFAFGLLGLDLLGLLAVPFGLSTFEPRPWVKKANVRV